MSLDWGLLICGNPGLAWTPDCVTNDSNQINNNYWTTYSHWLWANFVEHSIRDDSTCEGKLYCKWEEIRVDNGKCVVPQYVRIKTITSRWINRLDPSKFDVSKLSGQIKVSNFRYQKCLSPDCTSFEDGYSCSAWLISMTLSFMTMCIQRQTLVAIKCMQPNLE